MNFTIKPWQVVLNKLLESQIGEHVYFQFEMIHKHISDFVFCKIILLLDIFQIFRIFIKSSYFFTELKVYISLLILQFRFPKTYLVTKFFPDFFPDFCLDFHQILRFLHRINCLLFSYDMIIWFQSYSIFSSNIHISLQNQKFTSLLWYYSFFSQKLIR